jgi:hypothetical protein
MVIGPHPRVERRHRGSASRRQSTDRPRRRRLVLPEGGLQRGASRCKHVPASELEQRLLDDLGKRWMDVENAGGHLVDGVPEVAATVRQRALYRGIQLPLARRPAVLCQAEPPDTASMLAAVT